MTKTDIEDTKKNEQEQASEELEAYLNKTRPRNLAEGVTSGLNNVLSGTIGAVGGLVLAPVVGGTAGYKNAGIVGAVGGVVGGTVIGAVGGAFYLTKGVIQGTAQIIRGVASVPKSVAEPMKGKWWNDIDGIWVSTDLSKEEIAMRDIPENDKDIIGDEAANEDVKHENNCFSRVSVKNTFYYDVLGVPSDAEQAVIKRKYYIMARKFHPDKAGSDDSEAAENFKNASEAYQVLGDPTLRKIYDKDGINGLSADKTCVAASNDIDPTILFGFLFGSDKFNDYIGRLAVVTSTLVLGDIPLKDARKLQIRRCARIALKLAKKVDLWAHSENPDEVVKSWKAEAIKLSSAGFGYNLVVLLGQVYGCTATQFLGSLDSGVGMPSISKWAKGRIAKSKTDSTAAKAQGKTIKEGLKLAVAGKEAQAAMETAKTEAEKEVISKKLVKDQLTAMLKVMWTMTAVDVTSTIHEACQMIFFDKSVKKDKSFLKKRAKGVRLLGETFLACPKPKEVSDDYAAMFEEAAFAAMLETVKRKEDSQYKASWAP